MFTYSLRSDLAEMARETEDGPEEVIVEVFGVTAEREDGARWVLKFSTLNKVEAEAKLALVLAFAAGRSPVGSPKWVRIAGCYGSAAWDERDAIESEARVLDVEDPHEARRMRSVVGF